MLLDCVVSQVDEIVIDVEAVFFTGHAKITLFEEKERHVLFQENPDSDVEFTTVNQ